MTTTAKKPWPSDAVMIIASIAGEEQRYKMESVVDVDCRDCHLDLAADSYTIRTAENLPSRRGRPIKFFCPYCATMYDFDSITELHDHAGITKGL